MDILATNVGLLEEPLKFLFHKYLSMLDALPGKLHPSYLSGRYFKSLARKVFCGLSPLLTLPEIPRNEMIMTCYLRVALYREGE